MYAYPLALGALSIWTSLLVWRYADNSFRMPWGIYSGAYLLTTFTGALLIAVLGKGFLASLNYGVDVGVLSDMDTPTYWLLLYAPLVIPSLCILFWQGTRSPTYTAATNQGTMGDHLEVLPFLAVFGALTAYCIGCMLSGGFVGDLHKWTSLRGDYVSLILLRTELGRSLGSVFFCTVYITLPCLSFCALHQSTRYRSPGWIGALALTCLTTAVLSILTVQKGHLLVFILFMGVGLIELKVVRTWSVAGIIVIILVGLTAMQSYFSDDWHVSDSVWLIVFRMALSFPYYVSLFPDTLPHSGIDLGLHLIGIGEANRDAMDVCDYMYPGVSWVQGYAPAPAHVAAYSQGGVAYALATLVVVGLLLVASAALRRRVSGPVTFGLYMQSLVMCYYLTQTSLRESIMSCYGILWAFVGLIPCALLGSKQVYLSALRPGMGQPLHLERMQR
jgi:hypothetical protein